ncbi:MAG: class I SAM-dependent methyltransferase [Pirellulaceae bacterium]|nr:class I SAM-dependent methyltransferase [Pirellulaceae bacterium]
MSPALQSGAPHAPAVRQVPRREATPVKHCELCAGRRFDTLDHLDRKGEPLETIVCRSCGLVSHAQLPSEEALRLYYGRQYRQEYHGEWSPSPHRVVREWKRAGELLDRIGPYLKPGADVFEVGAGIGCTVKRFELAGYRASGIEPGEGFCQYSRQQLRAEVQPGLLEQVPQTASRDLVLLVHVLEHLRHPKQSLEHIRGLLKPGGLLYVEVPNFGLPHAAPGHIFHYAHIYNFTHATLVSLARHAGFELLRTFASPSGKDLQILFRAAEQPRPQIDPLGYRHAIEAVRRYCWLKYHLRWQYMSRRVRELTRRFAERLTARRQLAQIMALCDSTPPTSGPTLGDQLLDRPIQMVFPLKRDRCFQPG